MVDVRTSPVVPDKARLIRSLMGSETNAPYPASITKAGGGGKFSPHGDTLFHPGNTFICHIDRDSAFFSGLVSYQASLMASEFNQHFAFLRPASFHMTIFCGVSGAPLGADGWPDGYSNGMELNAITDQFAGQLAAWKGPNSFVVACDGIQKPTTIAMKPASSSDADALWDARRRLQSLTGLRRPDFAEYKFHVSLAYQIGWLTAGEAEHLVDLSNCLFERHLSRVGAIPLGPIEFCQFDTMQQFNPIMRLSNKPG